MVDLVKIRKKAKKGEGGEPLGAPPAASETETTLPPAPSRDSAVTAVAPAPLERAEPGLIPVAKDDSKLRRFIEEAGGRRDLANAGETATESEDLLEMLTFSIAGEQYAVGIEHIVEIVTPRTITRVPNADLSVVGIISLRGTIVTILDVRRKLKHPPAKGETADSRIIVMEHAGETVGFQVDRVSRVLKIEASAIGPHPVVHSSELSESIRGVFRTANALTILLDFDKLLDGRQQSAAS